MKRIILIVLGIGIVGEVGFILGWRRHHPVEKPATEMASIPAAEDRSVARADSVASRSPRQAQDTGAGLSVVAEAASPAPPSVRVSPNPEAATPGTFTLTIDRLVSPQSTYDQKQAAWKQLKDAGKLDQAIAELERRAQENPRAPEIPAALGQAYLQKAGTIKDVREQGFLGLKADQSFEAALGQDPSNWEARFWKATAMSYWPSQLNKGREVAEHFVELIKQQESQTPQPQFAQTYLLLGEQYRKWGCADYAKQVWQRGAGLFPDNTALREKLAVP